MKKLNEQALKVGDIILTTSTSKISKAIRTATRSDISHAMVYVQSHSVIDATDEGVQARNTQRLPFDDECAVHVLRLRDGLTVEQANKICQHVRSQIGTEYAVKEAVRSVLGGVRDWPRRQFCSRLVAQAYASAGVTLVGDPNYCSPAELKNSSALVDVPNAVIPISAAELALWDDREDVPQRMRDAINTVLDGARKKNPDIQSFDDLNRHIIEHPEDDQYVCELLNSSGYMTVWQSEMDKNPWQYDLRLMNRLRDAAMEEYCWATLADEEAGPSRYYLNRAGYAHLAKNFNRRTFDAFLDLYGLLATLHRKRVDVAADWLIAKGLLQSSEPPLVRPHSPEWFSALEAWDPPQARHVREIVAAARTPDVCSICGDDPAQDYRLPKRFRTPAGVDTLRLCDDCLGMRRTRMGEPYEGPV